MSRSNPLLWPKPPAIWSYGIAVFSVAAALIISRLPALHLQDAPVSFFLCAVILSAWFSGVGPGLLATALSALAFYYYFPPHLFVGYKARLRIGRSIIESHGGGLWAAHNFPRGASFTSLYPPKSRRMNDAR